MAGTVNSQPGVPLRFTVLIYFTTIVLKITLWVVCFLVPVATLVFRKYLSEVAVKLMEPAWYKYRSLDAISMQAYFLQILMLLLMAGQNLYRGCAYLKNKSEKYSSVMSRFADMLLVFCFLTTLLFTLPQKHDKDATIQDRCWVMLGYLCVEVLIQLVLFCLKQEEDLKPKPCGDGCTCGRHPEPEPEPTAALNETIGILNTNVDDDTSDVEAPPPSYEECMASAGSGRRVGGQRCCV